VVEAIRDQWVIAVGVGVLVALLAWLMIRKR
jgi:LPXTG-motif cell wall-anchored protein